MEKPRIIIKEQGYEYFAFDIDKMWVCESNLMIQPKTNDTWYGMTYHEDVAAVKDSFKKMLEKGEYKADLFVDLWYTGATGDRGSL